MSLTLTTGVYIFQNYLIISQQNDKTLQLIQVKFAFLIITGNKAQSLKVEYFFTLSFLV